MNVFVKPNEQSVKLAWMLCHGEKRSVTFSISESRESSLTLPSAEKVG